jgi:transcriptional regulator with XRE-family HTH domain/quercetin dioxygenase-like cupin family protein
MLGLRLRAARKKSGLTLRQVAKDLGLSPSFVSQMENGKSQPSVATLYSIARLLDVSIDELFDSGLEDPARPPFADIPEGSVSRGALADHDRSNAAGRRLGTRVTPTPAETGTAHDDRPFSHRTQDDLPRLVMDTGVVWEQLATSDDRNLDFMQITYPPGSTSTNDSRMLRHQGREYGYLLTGELEVVLEFETFTLHAGESLSLDSTRPHRFENHGRVNAQGIWAVHHCAVANGA